MPWSEHCRQTSRYSCCRSEDTWPICRATKPLWLSCTTVVWRSNGRPTFFERYIWSFGVCTRGVFEHFWFCAKAIRNSFNLFTLCFFHSKVSVTQTDYQFMHMSTWITGTSTVQQTRSHLLLCVCVLCCSLHDVHPWVYLTRTFLPLQYRFFSCFVLAFEPSWGYNDSTCRTGQYRYESAFDYQIIGYRFEPININVFRFVRVK